jgi:RNA polymerase sigma-70 factor (ECF subfamily)
MTNPKDRDFRGSVVAARTGDPAAFNSLFGRHLSALRAFVRVKAGPGVQRRESVDDLVQSVCREIIEDLDQFEYRGEDAFRAWLFLAASRKIVDRHRFQNRERRSPQREQPLARHDDDTAMEGLLGCYATFCTPSRVVNAREEVARIEDVLEKLPEQQREAVSLSRMMGLPYTEVAEIMDRTVSSVRSLVARGLARLAEELD